jgi:plastocyanin
VRTRKGAAALAAVAAIGASALVIGPAVAAGGGGGQAQLQVVGGVTLKPGKSITDNQRFAQRNLRVRSGQTVRLRNRAKTEDPHTLSLVRRRDLPRTPADVFNCEACGPFFGAHQVNEETGDVGQPLVNVGAEGFDQPGDSIFFGPGQTVRFDVTADEGRTLYYLCAVHAWMQGKLRVR